MSFKRCTGWVAAHFHVTRSSVQVHVQILDLSILSKHVLNVLLTRLLVHVGDNDDPAFYAAHSDCLLGCSSVVRVSGLPRASWRRRLVDVHLCVGHDGKVVSYESCQVLSQDKVNERKISLERPRPGLLERRLVLVVCDISAKSTSLLSGSQVLCLTQQQVLRERAVSCTWAMASLMRY